MLSILESIEVIGGKMYDFHTSIRGSVFQLLVGCAALLTFWNSARSDQLGLKYASTIFWQGINSFAVRDNIAYCLNAQGIRLIDISNRGTPLELTTLPWECRPAMLVLASDRLLMIDESDQLNVIAINPDWSLRRLGSIQLDVWPCDVEVVGEFAFVLDGNPSDGFVVKVVDISAPLSPTLILSTPVGNGGRSLSIWENRLYIGTGYPEGSVIVWDISDPTAPGAIGSLTNLGEFRGLAVRNDTLFVISDTPDLRTWDCRDLSNPRLVSTYDSPSRPAKLGLIRDRVLLGNIDHSLRIVNMTNPAVPFTDSVIEGARANVSIWTAGEDAFVGDGWNMRALNFAAPENPQWVLDLSSAGMPIDLELNGNTLFVARGDSGILALDISNVLQPSVSWQWAVTACEDNNCDAQAVKVVNGRLYCNFKDGILRVFELSEPASPDPMAEIGSPWNGSIGGSINGDTLVMTRTDGMVIAVDFVDPAAPVALATISGPQKTCLAVRDYTVALTTRNFDGYSGSQINLGLELYRLTDLLEVAAQSSFSDFQELCHWESRPHEPPYVFCQPTGPENAAFVGSSLIVNTPTGGLMAIDISEFDAPVATFLQHESAYPLLTYYGSIAFDGGHAFASRSNENEIETFEVSDESNPVLLNTVQANDFIRDLVASDDALFVATSTGIVIYQYDQAVAVDDDAELAPSDFALYQNHPNPFNAGTTIAFQTKRASFVRVSVYNILGQSVRTLVEEYLPAGAHSVGWNGRDQNDRTVASGVYFYRVHAGEFSETRKMLLLK